MDSLDEHPSAVPRGVTLLRRHAVAFFILGLLNNMMYVVILTAALEILPSHVPTGILAFVNIAPAVVSKALFPYYFKGEIWYGWRVWACTLGSFCGMMCIAFFPGLFLRLVGIGIASFASGLGEITFLQYATRYPHQVTTYCIGWFASGTGAAGLIGASAWWIVRPLGVRGGLGLLSLLSFGTALSFFVILPLPSIMSRSMDETTEALMQDSDREPERNLSLSFSDKAQLLKPMLIPYIMPLICVYFAEYTINQGVAPTLLFTVPDSKQHKLLSMIIHSLRDYYPLYQLVYQAFVFISRSYTSILPLPPIPKAWLWSPAILQVCLLVLLSSESIYDWFKASIARSLVIVLVAVEGLAGGSSYVSVMSHIGGSDRAHTLPQEYSARTIQEYEFKIGSVSLGDSLGIVLATLVSIPLQVSLCHMQVARGRDLCTRV